MTTPAEPIHIFEVTTHTGTARFTYDDESTRDNCFEMAAHAVIHGIVGFIVEDGITDAVVAYRTAEVRYVRKFTPTA